MSHFPVCVVIPHENICKQADERWALEEQLARIMEPFCEDTYDEGQTEFIDLTDDLKVKYLTDTMVLVQYSDGQLTRVFDEEFEKHFFISNDEIKVKNPSRYFRTHSVCEYQGMKLLKDYPVKDYFKDFSRYCSEYMSCVQDEHGRWGNFVNPEARWDWYEIGGRFQNFLWTCRDGQTQFQNWAQMKDIMWPEMKTKMAKALHESYQNYKEAFETKDLSKLLCFATLKNDGVYCFDLCLYSDGESFEAFTERNGLGSEIDYAINICAMVDRYGIWHDNENYTDIDWIRMTQQLLGTVKPDDYIVIVDCHN